MAIRRRRSTRLQGALAGAAEGLGTLNQFLLQRALQQGQQEALLARQSDLNLINFVQKAAETGNLHLLSPELRRRARGLVDFDTVMAPQRLGAPVSKRIADTKTVSDLPSELDMIALLGAEGVDVDPVLQYVGNRGEPGDLPSANLMPTQPSSIQRFLDQRGQRRSDILAEEQRLRGLKLTDVESVDPTGRRIKQFIPETELSGQTFYQEPTPEQQGEQKRTELLTGELSGDVTSAKATQEGAVAGSRRRAELAAEAARLGLTSQQQQAALALADDFQNQSRDYFVIADRFRTITSVANKPSAAGDIALVFGFLKMQDPNSAVLQGEQATAQNAAGVPERLRRLYNNILAGDLLSPEQRKDFFVQAGNIFTASTQEHRRRVELFKERARQFSVPDFLVIREADPALLQSVPRDGQPTIPPMRPMPSHFKQYEILSIRPAGSQ